MSTTTTTVTTTVDPSIVAKASKALNGTKAPKAAKTPKAAKPAVKKAAATGELPKSVAKRLARKRFSFGPVWNHAVVSGAVTDQAKLQAQAEQLQIALPKDASFEDLKAAVALQLIETGALNETAETAAA